jgi:hypothetical protein
MATAAAGRPFAEWAKGGAYMLTNISAEDVRAFIRMSEAAAGQGDRLTDRMVKADLLPSGDEPQQIHPARRDEAELNDLSALGATTMADKLRRLETALADLSPEARRELHAIALVGRGEYAARQWDEALTAAEARQTEDEPRALAEDPEFAPQLAKGLYLLKLA